MGASNEYPHCMFSWRNKKNIFVDTPSHLELCFPLIHSIVFNESVS